MQPKFATVCRRSYPNTNQQNADPAIAMPENASTQQHMNRRQPPGGHPQGAAPFLRALSGADAAALAAWAAEAQPDVRWAEWLSRQNLAPLGFYRLRQAGALAALPAEVVWVLREAYYNAVGSAELHTRELTNVLDVLATAGVTPVLFKGAVLAYTAYPDPSCRPMGDLDLWIDLDAMPQAQAALESRGYEERLRTRRPAALQSQREGEIQLMGRAPGSGLVELHWGIFAGEWLHRTAAVDDGGLRSRAVPVTVAGRPALMLTPEDAIIQLAAHLAVNHQMAAPGLRGLLDVALLARSQPIDWSAVAERAHLWRMANATWLVLDLTSTLFGLPASADAIGGLRPGVVRRRLLSRLAHADSVLAGRDLTLGPLPLRFIYQLLLVDRARDAARLLGRALWPEDDWLAARYGMATPTVRWRHLWAALRGRP